MKPILNATDTKTFYHLYYTGVNSHILQIIFKQILIIWKKLKRHQKVNISQRNFKFSGFCCYRGKYYLNHEEIQSTIKFSKSKFHEFFIFCYLLFSCLQENFYVVHDNIDAFFILKLMTFFFSKTILVETGCMSNHYFSWLFKHPVF